MMLMFNGHPLYDIGVATITAFANKKRPSEVTEEDLDKIADFMEKQYTVDPLKSFLTVAFPNSGFTQPAYNKQPEKRLEYARVVLRSYKKDSPVLKEKCVFTGAPAVGIAFSETLPPGRAYRQHIPLITGEDVINFHPGGNAGLPVSGVAMLCIQAFPLGCAKCAGKLLAVHSDNTDVLLYFAKEFLANNRANLAFAQASGSSKMPEFVFSQRTLLIDTLLKAMEEINLFKEDRDETFSVTAYHLSNSGQSPSLDIYHLPLEMVTFLKKARSADYRDEWQRIVKKAWQINTESPKRNYLYEDIFHLPENAKEFLQVYFLRMSLKWAKKDDPRGGYSIQDDLDMVSWRLTELFLREVMEMNKERIEQIRLLGDRLASYVKENNDKGFFRNFFVEQRGYDYLRSHLLKANLRQVKQGKAPLLNFDPYLEVFEEGEELAYRDWRLARDLLLIRMIERLYEQGWLGSNQDTLSDLEENEKEDI